MALSRGSGLRNMTRTYVPSRHRASRDPGTGPEAARSGAPMFRNRDGFRGPGAPGRRPAGAQAVRSDASADYYRIEMKAVQAQLVPGYSTLLFGYNGLVPGPTIKARKGRATVVRFVNNLPAKHPIQ